LFGFMRIQKNGDSELIPFTAIVILFGVGMLSVTLKISNNIGSYIT